MVNLLHMPTGTSAERAEARSRGLPVGRRGQFLKDIRVICPFCAGKYADTELTVEWREGPKGDPGSYIHHVSGGHVTMCLATAIRVASPDLNGWAQDVLPVDAR